MSTNLFWWAFLYAKNPDNVKVYYYNEGLEEWELIGGTYKDGVVTAETNHFSTYAVFEKEEIDEEETSEETNSDSIEEQDDDETEVAAGVPADANPNSSSNVVWWIVFGLVVMGLAIVFVRKRFKKGT